MADPPSGRIDSEIEAYYALGLEASRLGEAYFPLEEARSRELILRHLPQGPLRILDVGGASGRYALWLAGLDHEVHLVDLDASLDAVLMLGPLYHLGERPARLAALRELPHPPEPPSAEGKSALMLPAASAPRSAS